MDNSSPDVPVVFWDSTATTDSSIQMNEENI